MPMMSGVGAPVVTPGRLIRDRHWTVSVARAISDVSDMT